MNDDTLLSVLVDNTDDASRARIDSAIATSVVPFIAAHSQAGERIALVTSGGTTVPLERNAVRFVSNFSTGGRGSKLAEELLSRGWCVIFLGKKGSQHPFHRHIAQHAAPLELVQAALNGTLSDDVRHAAQRYAEAKERLCVLPFDTVQEYLYALRAASLAVARFPRRPLIVLAAAVSDYYIPREHLAQHKLSGAAADGTISLTFHQVPKVLGMVREAWCPTAAIVSFKLETDPDAIEGKAVKNLHTYRNDIVVANLLASYTQRATLYKALDHTTQMHATTKIEAGEFTLEHQIVDAAEAL